MEIPKPKSVAVFSRPFTVTDFDEMLPAGTYDIETGPSAPPDDRNPDAACARDKFTGKERTGFFLERMLADPMVRLVMAADGVSEMQLRHLYTGKYWSEAVSDALSAVCEFKTPQDRSSILAGGQHR